jgi:hypothetical protein
MTTEGDASTPFDLYEVGRKWPVDPDAFAARWRVDAVELRKALNLAAHEESWLALDTSPGRIRTDLEKIAEAGETLARAIENAANGSIHQWLVCVVPARQLGRLLQDPAAYRDRHAAEIRRWAEQAREMSKDLEVNRRPASGRTGRPTHRELAIVSALARVWRSTRKEAPNVTYRHKNEPGTRAAADGRREGNEGARFVVEAAKAFFDLTMSDQRLQTVLKNLTPRAAKT